MLVTQADFVPLKPKIIPSFGRDLILKEGIKNSSIEE